MLYTLLKIPCILYIINCIENVYRNRLTITEKKKEIVNNIININHAVYITAFSFLFYIDYITISVYENVLFIILIYNIRDSFKYYYFNLDMRNEMLFHHSILIIGILLKYIATNPFIYTKYLSLNFLTEISTPTLNISHSLYMLNQKNNLLYKVSNIITVIFFFLFRIVMITYLLFDELYNDKFVDKHFCVFQMILILLNYFWFYKICKIFIKQK